MRLKKLASTIATLYNRSVPKYIKYYIINYFIDNSLNCVERRGIIRYIISRDSPNHNLHKMVFEVIK